VPKAAPPGRNDDEPALFGAARDSSTADPPHFSAEKPKRIGLARMPERQRPSLARHLDATGQKAGPKPDRGAKTRAV